METGQGTQLDRIEARVEAMDRKVNLIYRIFLVTVVGSVILFVLPLIGIAFVLPTLVSTYGGLLQ
jgi:hypothetical protein